MNHHFVQYFLPLHFQSSHYPRSIHLENRLNRYQIKSMYLPDRYFKKLLEELEVGEVEKEAVEEMVAL